MKKISRKTLKIGSFTLISTAVVLAILVFVNLFVGELPSKITSIDTTAEKVYGIGEVTTELLGTVKDEVNIYLLAESASSSQTVIQVEEYIQKYADLNSNIKYTRIDPALQPTFAKNYTEDSLSSGSVIVESGTRSKVINGTEWFMYDTQYGEMTPEMYQSYQMYGYVDGSDPLMFYGEMKLTGAISFVTSEDLPVIYFTTGHGEATLDSTYQEYISNENIETKSMSLLTGDGAVPEDCSILFINMPQTDFSEAEVSAVKDYYMNGGDVMLITYCLYYSAESMPNLTSLAETMGLTPVDGIIIESNPYNYMQYPYCLVPDATLSGPISNLSNYTFISAFAHGVKAVEGSGAEALELLTTSEDAFIKKDVQNLSTYEKEDGDGTGPFSTAAITSLETNGQTAYFTWLTSPCAVDPNYDMGGGNSAFFTSTINWMCEKETNVSILGVNISSSPLATTEADVAIWGFILVGIVPLAFLAGGFAVWFRRRRK